jgi:invasion protein IalB
MFKSLKNLMLFFSMLFFSTSSFTDSHSEFNDTKWSKICVKSKDECIIGINNLLKQKDKKPVKFSVFYIGLQVSIKNEMKVVDQNNQTYKLEKKKINTPILYISFPVSLDVDLTISPSLRVDGTEIARLQITNCNAGGCTAITLIDQRVLNSLKSGKNASVVMKLFEKDQNFQISVSLKNFTKSYKNLTS